MKKNLIIYIVAGAVALAGITTGIIFAVKKLNNAKDDGTSSSVTQAFDEDFGTDGYTVFEEPSEELSTDEDGNFIEMYTDEEGSTHQAVLVTDANGEFVTDTNGEKVTSKKNPASENTTKKVTTTKKPSQSSIADGTKVDSNSTVKNNGDGTVSIVKSDGTVALSYSYSAAGNYFYTDDNPWQRNMGFNRLYDMGAAFTVMYYDTIRIKYHYGNYDWMVQMWKGQYGLIFIGSEIGLYYRETGKSTDHYNCATEAMELNMQMTLYRDGYGEMFTRPYAPHWWITAFVPGKLKKFSDRSELTMVGKIQFKSNDERKLFCAALEKCTDLDGNHFTYVSQISKNNPETYTFRDRTVDFVWRYFDADRKTSTKPATTTNKPATTTSSKPTETTTNKPTTPPVTAPIVVDPDTTTAHDISTPSAD